MGHEDIIRIRLQEEDDDYVKVPGFKERVYQLLELYGGKILEALEMECMETARLEQEYTRLRWTVFAGLTTLSFAMTGYIVSKTDISSLSKDCGLLFSWFVQFCATVFYWWFHRISHSLRDYLVAIEKLVGFYKYTIRSKRPRPSLKAMGFKVRFCHFVYCLTLLYLITVVVFIVTLCSS